MIIVVMIVMSLGQFTDALDKIHAFFKPSSAPSSPVNKENTADILKRVYDGYNFPGKYQWGPFSLVGDGECLENSVITDNHLEFKFVITNPTVLMDLSPLVVRILRPESGSSRTKIYEDHFSFKTGTNIVKMQINLPAGHYILEYGFFLTSESGSEFQKCYQNVCEFRRF
jgi:hypothetical protein